jgi:hypothetical protein
MESQSVRKLTTLPIMNVYINYGRTFVSFRLKSEAASNARCSIGGGPPTGVKPRKVEAATRYFATLGLEDGVDVSLFSTFDYVSRPSPFNFFCAAYKLHDQSNPIVQFVVHEQSPGRETASPLRNILPMLGFVFGAQGTDPECPVVEALGNPAIYSDHKIGGQPFFSQLEGDVGAALELLRSGYVHLLQMAFPSSNDSLTNADWPFGESVFHVFAKREGSFFAFRYIWA